MMQPKKYIYILLQCIWGLPQTLLGALLFLRYSKAAHTRFRGAVMTFWPRRGGVSLGLFTFVPDEANEPSPEKLSSLAAHEYGHTLQSLMLGPLYLLIVGIVSFLWANLPFFRRLRRERGIPYSRCYTEKWADRLGGA
ncbi:MAG: hypothetical protein E7330_05610 [Clostridiales bacterium]|nr:hypothetical protein [Clostridiales bacterium]